MKRIITGYFYEKTGFFSGFAFNKEKASKEITWPPSGSEKPFVVLENNRLICYFPYKKDSSYGHEEKNYKQGGHGGYWVGEVENSWARAVYNPNNNNTSYQIINFTTHTTAPIQKKYGCDDIIPKDLSTQIQQLFNSANLHLPNNLRKNLSSFVPHGDYPDVNQFSLDAQKDIDAALQGEDHALVDLTENEQRQILQAAFSGNSYSILSLSPELQRKAYNIRYYLLPENFHKINSSSSKDYAAAYHYIVWRFALGDETLCALAKQALSNHQRSAEEQKRTCSGAFVREMFIDFCSPRRTIDWIDNRVFNKFFYDSISGLSLCELQQCKEMIVSYRQPSTKENLNSNQFKQQVDFDLRAIAQIHESTVTAQEKKIYDFYDAMMAVLDKRIIELNKIIKSESFEAGYAWKEDVINSAVLRSITATQAVNLFKNFSRKLSFEKLLLVLKNEGFEGVHFLNCLQDETLSNAINNNVHLINSCSLKELKNETQVALLLRLFKLNISHVNQNKNRFLSQVLKDLSTQKQNSLIIALGGWGNIIANPLDTIVLASIFSCFKTEDKQKHFKDFFIEWQKTMQKSFAVHKMIQLLFPETENESLALIEQHKPTDNSIKRETKYCIERQKYRDQYASQRLTPKDILQKIESITPSNLKGESPPSFYLNDIKDDLMKALLFLHKTLEKIDTAHQKQTYTFSEKILLPDGETAMLIMLAIDMIENELIEKNQEKNYLAKSASFTLK
ncbi:MAG: hypothetical protein WC748_02495 [Legionellales bacterium]|jgi:hypothetical protein